MAKRADWGDFRQWLTLCRRKKLENGDHPLRLGTIDVLKKLARTAKYEVAVLAGLCGICERTLERYMAVDYQETPSSWLRCLQISDSIPLLCNGMKIKEVAVALHFENATDFARAFRRQIGFCPSEFYRLWIQ